MMYPRLKMLQRLLSIDGAIFISIDDNEQYNLRALCNEVFGASNYLTSFIWRKVDSPNDNKVAVTPDHEYILCYAKNLTTISLFPMPSAQILDAYGQMDENGRRYRDRLLKKNGRNSLRRDRPTMFFLSLRRTDQKSILFTTMEKKHGGQWEKRVYKNKLKQEHLFGNKE